MKPMARRNLLVWHLAPMFGAYHDENNNSRLDTDFIGYPTEGYALSNGIGAVISRPRVSDAAFAVGPTKTPT